eukprot:Nitzschia sp. Nitz4//scaffold56_size114212//60999//61829//NITZ4_003951-RA/size114212-processed-gene-0.66-mRNA-1//-1//CDS//3329554709//2038//frame0
MTIPKEAFTEVVDAITRDMPLIMHGSGDVDPSSVDPAACRLLSELTADYIANLVHAAVDTQELLNGGPRSLPPAPLARSHKTAIPRPYESKPPNPPADTKNSAIQVPEKPNRKRRRTTDEFWDEPLPQPKIKNKPTKGTETTGPKYDGVPVDEWVGVSGVDFYQADRARRAHVAVPHAISTQSFIFPVCHDTGLYGKVLEIQAARRTIAPLLVDPVIQNIVKTEGGLQGPGSFRKRKKGEEPEEEESDAGGEESNAVWPGLDYLLPVHMGMDPNTL